MYTGASSGPDSPDRIWGPGPYGGPQRGPGSRQEGNGWEGEKGKYEKRGEKKKKKKS